MHTLQSRVRLAALITIFLAASAASTAAEIGSIRLAWDPNPEPDVVGYVVYVGTEPGVYPQTFDVGVQTTFAYAEAVLGRRYYFAVAAYATERQVGPRSTEISGVTTVQTPAPATPPSVVPPGMLPERTGGGQQQVCTEAAPTCYSARLIASALGRVSLLKSTTDGRLLFIEDGERVRVMVGGSLVEEPALAVERRSGVRLTSLAFDPDFARTRFVFVAEATPLGDGSRELTIVRYREVQNRLAEGSPVVSGLRVPASGETPFTVDSRGRLYVAIPAAAGTGPAARDPYAASVLRFNVDGTVPSDSRNASPVFARGYANPTVLEWDAAGERLWVAGLDPELPGPLATLRLNSPERDRWPLSLSAVHFEDSQPGGISLRPSAMAFDHGGGATASSMLWLTDAAGRLLVAPTPSGEATGRLRVFALAHEDSPTGVAAGAEGRMYIALRIAAADGTETFAILELRRALEPLR